MEVRGSELIRISLKPIFISSWIFGVPRVSYKCSYRVIYAVIISVIYIATFSTTIDSRINLVSSFNSTTVISYIFSQFVMFLGGIGTIIFWVVKGAKALEYAIMELAELDIELKDLGMNVDENNRKIVRQQIGLISLFFILWIVTVIMYEYIINLMGSNDNSTVLEIFCLAYSSHGPHLLVLFGELVFSTIMYIFYQRFKWINITLMEISKNQEYPHAGRTFHVIPAGYVSNLSTRKTNVREFLLPKIERLYKIHQRLCEISEKVSWSFSWQSYFAVSVTFTLLIYRLMILYSFAFLKLEKLGVRIGLSVLWIIYYILKFWMITLTCSNTSAEANKLGIMLYDIVINDMKYQRMLHEYSAQLYQNELYFTAGGFFPIDISLVNSLISHITTYILFAVDVWRDTEKEYSKSTTIID